MKFDLLKGLYFAPDTGNGSGGAGAGQGDQSNDDQNNGNQGDGAGAGNGDQNTGGEDKITLTRAELQKQIDDAIKTRLERERKKAEADAAKVKEQAEAQALAQQQKWQELAEKHASKVAELEKELAGLQALQEQSDRYKGALESQLQAVKKDLPKHLVQLLDKLDPVEQLEYIAANSESFGRPDGPDPSPSGNGRGALSEESKVKAAAEQRKLYSNW